eukprot:scaffold644_cov357-Pavlova_lutheri.AAC.44
MAQESPWMPVPHQHRSLRAPLDSISCSDGSLVDMCMYMDGTGIAHVAPSPGALMVERGLHTWRTGNGPGLRSSGRNHPGRQLDE